MRTGSSSLGFCVDRPQAFLFQRLSVQVLPPSATEACTLPSVPWWASALIQHRKCQLQCCRQSGIPARPRRSGLG